MLYRKVQNIFNYVKYNLRVYLSQKSSSVFIAVNVFVSVFGFFRSFAFIKFFDFKELGIITLVSTAAMVIAFLQLGLINGGYRIIALHDKDSNNKVNNVIFSYFLVLTLVLVGFTFVTMCFGFIPDWEIAFLVIFIGIFSLVTNWLTNTLIGGGEFNRLNIANFISALSSLLCLVFAYYYGLIGAITSLLIQPLLFVVIVFITDKKEIPTHFDLDYKYIKHILSFGFIPYLSGIFFLLYQQIERWSVNYFLGSEALGKIYLVFLTTALWVLIPSSINSLFFPKSVKYFENGDRNQLKTTIYNYFIILAIYCFIAVLMLFLLFSPLVEFVFPKHLPYVKLVYIILPALILRTLADPLVLLFNSIVKMNPILWSDIISTVFYIFLIFALHFFKIFSLENVLICYGFYNLIRFCYLFVNFILLKRKKLI